VQYEVRQTAQFEAWLDSLTDPIAQKAISRRLVRVAGGLFGDVAPVGNGVSELRIHVGAGYRCYFTIRQRTIVFMLCGGDKSSQKRDIKDAKAMAADL
jgi:putative addiction module killer protein